MGISKSGSSRQLWWLRHALEARSASFFALVLFAVLGAFGYFQLLDNGVIVLVLFGIIVYEFSKRLDQGVPLLQLTSLLAVLQWLVGPLLNYASDLTYGRYSMYVPEEVYFRYAIPATSLYLLIMLSVGSSVRQSFLLTGIDRRNFVLIGFLLNLVAILATVLAGRFSGGLSFLFHLISQVRYVGALYFLFSLHPYRYILAAISCVHLFSRSLGEGMFHDLILWLAILFSYWFAQRKWTVSTKVTILVAVALSLFVLQSIKQEYRRQLRSGVTPFIPTLAIDYLQPGGKAWSVDSLSLTITRLNQGWIISSILNNVPAHEPFARGETVVEAIKVSLVPRVFWPDKKTAGGRESFRRFTGLQIGNETSMGISPLGEAYANYGVEGGILFMGVFGAFFALFYYIALWYTARHPTFFFWLPLIFYQAMKAETELSIVVNQLTKGSVVAFGIFFVLNRCFPNRRNVVWERVVKQTTQESRLEAGGLKS